MILSMLSIFYCPLISRSSRYAYASHQSVEFNRSSLNNPMIPRQWCSRKENCRPKPANWCVVLLLKMGLRLLSIALALAPSAASCVEAMSVT